MLKTVVESIQKPKGVTMGLNNIFPLVWLDSDD